MHLHRVVAAVTTLGIALSGCCQRADPNVAELQKRGFTDIRQIDYGSYGNETYSASVGVCRATLLWTGAPKSPRYWEVTLNNVTINGPTKALIQADPRFAACFPA